MGIETLASKEFAEAARFRLSVMAEIFMRENPELENVFKVLNQLYNEKAGILRDMVTYREEPESIALLQSQLDHVDFDLESTEEYLKEIINHKNN